MIEIDNRYMLLDEARTIVMGLETLCQSAKCIDYKCGYKIEGDWRIPCPIGELLKSAMGTHEFHEAWEKIIEWEQREEL